VLQYGSELRSKGARGKKYHKQRTPLRKILPEKVIGPQTILKFPALLRKLKAHRRVHKKLPMISFSNREIQSTRSY
jgi:hypothetical protein